MLFLMMSEIQHVFCDLPFLLIHTTNIYVDRDRNIFSHCLACYTCHKITHIRITLKREYIVKVVGRTLHAQGCMTEGGIEGVRGLGYEQAGGDEVAAVGQDFDRGIGQGAGVAISGLGREEGGGCQEGGGKTREPKARAASGTADTMSHKSFYPSHSFLLDTIVSIVVQNYNFLQNWPNFIVDNFLIPVISRLGRADQPSMSICTMRSAVRPSQRSGSAPSFHSPRAMRPTIWPSSSGSSPTSSFVPTFTVSMCSV